MNHRQELARCYELNRASPIYMLKPKSPIPTNVTVSGDTAFKEVIQSKMWLVWLLTWCNWCHCYKRKFGHTERERPGTYVHRGKAMRDHKEKMNICNIKGEVSVKS